MEEENRKRTLLKNIKHLLISKYLRMGIVITLITGFIGLGCFLFILEKNPKYIDHSTPVYNYTNKLDITYGVFMLPNEILTEKSYGPGKIYITSLIDYIDTTVNYTFRGELPAQLRSKYTITASLEGFISGEEGSNIIWKKQYTLLPEKSLSKNDKVLTIKERIPIKFSDYSVYLEMVKKSLEFSYSSRLVIKWDVLTEVKVDEGSKEEMISSVMEIPISKEYFKIDGELAQETKGTIDKTEKIISPTYLKIKASCWIGTALSAILLVFMILFTKPYTIDSPLQKKLKKVFKSHGSRMVGLGSETSINANELIEVSSMEDLVKIADDVGRPVMYRKSIDPENIYYFYVIEENNIYVFDIRKTIVYPPAEKSVDTDTMSI